MYLLLKYVVTLSFVIWTVQAARILGVVPTPSVSHQVVFHPIWRELSLRGHQVTVITTDPLKDSSLSNLTEVDISMLYGFFREMLKGFVQEQTHWDIMRTMAGGLGMLYESIFEHPEVAQLINGTNHSFDLVMTEFLSPVMNGFGYKYNCPVIGMASLSVLNPAHQAVGNPTHPILFPDFLTTFGEDLSFLEKIDAVVYYAYMQYTYITHHLPLYDAIARKYFGNDLPYIGELEKNISMLFLNTNPILHRPRPYGQAIIEMGSMHLKPKKPLPKDIKAYLDDAKEGVIYFSLGSNIKSVNIDPTKRNIIMEVLSELPYKILWKFEDDSMPDKPSNVKIQKWLPQQDILDHPNIKLFITQAGLQSTEEAIANRVPMLALPFMADQHANAKRITKLGIGLHLQFSTLVKEEFKKSIIEIVENPKYKEKISEIADFMKDQPMTGLEKAVWWTEYVLRHNGAPYFRSRAVDMSWYEYLLLDVLAFFAFALFAIIFTLYKGSKFLWHKLINVSSKRKTE